MNKINFSDFRRLSIQHLNLIVDEAQKAIQEKITAEHERVKKELKVIAWNILEACRTIPDDKNVYYVYREIIQIKDLYIREEVYCKNHVVCGREDCIWKKGIVSKACFDGIMYSLAFSLETVCTNCYHTKKYNTIPNEGIFKDFFEVYLLNNFDLVVKLLL